MSIIKHGLNVHEVNTIYKGKTEFDYLLLSDIHFDSRDCHRELLKKHLKEIKDKNGIAFIFGDLFDVMGCKNDPRSSPAHIRKEYLQTDRSYLDLVIEDAYEFLKPFKDNIGVIGYGNHETSIMKFRDTDPLERIAMMLDKKDLIGGYSGYIKFAYRQESKGKKHGIRNSRLAYHHGYGGAKRSKGILNAQIDGFTYPDADIIVSGHDHNKLHDPSNVRYYLAANNKIVYKDQHWLKCGSYTRNDDAPLVNGWHVERGFLPKKMGGWKMKHVVDHNDQFVEMKIEEAT